VPGIGGKDRLDKLISQYAGVIGLKDWRVWDAVQITALLDANPRIRRAFAATITPSDLLAQLRDRLDETPVVSVVLGAAAVAPGSQAARQLSRRPTTLAAALSGSGQRSVRSPKTARAGCSTSPAAPAVGPPLSARDIMNPAAAIPAAASLLLANGAPANIPAAIFAYNHSPDYVTEVLDWASTYASGRYTVSASRQANCTLAATPAISKSAAEILADATTRAGSSMRTLAGYVHRSGNNTNVLARYRRAVEMRWLAICSSRHPVMAHQPGW
jgi:hypothetical protein